MSVAPGHLHPVIALKTTRLITRGFSRARKSRGSARARGVPPLSGEAARTGVWKRSRKVAAFQAALGTIVVFRPTW
jgi:hypothetical protein